MRVQKSPVYLQLNGQEKGSLIGSPVIQGKKYLKDLPGYFADIEAAEAMEPETILYEVCAWQPISEGTQGGLFYGLSIVYPGRVGQEFFMTKGHFHAELDTAEFYWGVAGRGLLLFMDEDRQNWAEVVEPGSLHYIPGKVAHRLVNTATEPLKVGACWPSNAGHDYSNIEQTGFSLRVFAADTPEGYQIQQVQAE